MSILFMWVVSLLLAANIVVTLALVRRVREIELAGQNDFPSGLPKPGTKVGEFSAVTLDGRTISQETFAHGSRLAVFLLPGCDSCHGVVEALARFSGDSTSLVVFIAGATSDPEVKNVIEALPGHAAVALINVISDPALKAMKIAVYPAIVNVVDGVIASAYDRMVSGTSQAISES
ncbi:hypothetical protein ACSDR0_46110 [Streptosporangium sp. G11]|uniref:hypothetical protein n=1 Tax=Streptosporangium sp. G11 TaxID=3436926 RepID=UPI003EB6E8EF